MLDALLVSVVYWRDFNLDDAAAEDVGTSVASVAGGADVGACCRL